MLIADDEDDAAPPPGVAPPVAAPPVASPAAAPPGSFPNASLLWRFFLPLAMNVVTKRSPASYPPPHH
eukprot:COSAG01_NODE_65281_length_273_cov_6.321839_1_plen_67_part_01